MEPANLNRHFESTLVLLTSASSPRGAGFHDRGGACPCPSYVVFVAAKLNVEGDLRTVRALEGFPQHKGGPGWPMRLQKTSKPARFAAVCASSSITSRSRGTSVKPAVVFGGNVTCRSAPDVNRQDLTPILSSCKVFPDQLHRKASSNNDCSKNPNPSETQPYP